MRKWVCVLAVSLLAVSGACSSQPPDDTATEVVVAAGPTTVDDVSTPTPQPETSATPAPAPTVAPSPTPQPPKLEVIDPAPGARVDRAVYLFRGTTDPDSTVTAAGQYPADVADDGTWQVVLVLEPGSNIASFVATDPTGLESTAEVVVWYDPPVHYLKYGETGLYRVTGQGEELIHAGPVSSATTDGADGVVFGVNGPTGFDHYWWPEREEPLPLEGWVFDGLAVNGHPTVISIGHAPDLCADTYWQDAVYLTDLATGTQTFLFCDTDGPDGGNAVTSIGGQLISTIGWEIWGPWTSHSIQLIDISGNRIPWTANPVPESCAPCELDAVLSPDGQFLAYRHRPDSYWPSDRVSEMSEDEWWAATQAIPGAIRVIDVETGVARFETEVPATARLVDFDGRYIVVADSQAIWPWENIDHSDIIDTTGALPPITIGGNWHIDLIPGPAAG